MSNLVPFDQIEKMSLAISKSGLFGVKNADQALALMLIAQAEGMHPAVAARDYHIVQGRPALKADSMLARFQAAGGKVNWLSYTDDKVEATFSHPSGGAVTLAWTIGQAKAAGLTGKDVWKQYPRAMLRARVISEGIRTVYPGVAVGVYTPEEVEDFNAKPATKEVHVEVSAPVQEIAPALPAIEPKPQANERSLIGARIKAVIGSKVWSKEQVSDYCSNLFGTKDSSKLSIDQLETLASVLESSTYEMAMIEVQDDQL